MAKAYRLAALKRRLNAAVARRSLHSAAAGLGAALSLWAALMPATTLALSKEPLAPGAGLSGFRAAPATTPAPYANRVITLAPHATELVFAAGGGDTLIATVNSSNYPPRALTLPRVGDGLSINAEQLLNLQPDLIIGWQSMMAIQKLQPVLTRLDIAVAYSEPRLLDDIPADIEQLGRLLGTQPQAEAAARELRQQLAALRATYAWRAPVSVFIEVGASPLYTLGDDRLTNDAITACGGVNVFQDSALVAPTVTVETVLARDPDVVIIASAAARRVVQRAAYWKGLRLRAAQQGRVHGAHPDKLLRPGPRLVQATQELCDTLDRARQ